MIRLALLVIMTNCLGSESISSRHRRESPVPRESELASREDLALAVIAEQTLSPSRLWRESEGEFKKILNTELDSAIVPEDLLDLNGQSWIWTTRRYITRYPYNVGLLGGEGELCDKLRFKANFDRRLRAAEGRLPPVVLNLNGPAQKLGGCKHALCLGCVKELRKHSVSAAEPEALCPTCRTPFISYYQLTDSDSKGDDNCAVCQEALEIAPPLAKQARTRH